ncbi:MAG: pilus assembly protein [Magnetospirillum sp. WYHS-4]
MPRRSVPTPNDRWFRFLRRTARDERGATAVEFALILPVFAYLLIGIIEMAMLFFTTTVVDGAVHEAGRRIRTGQAQLSGNTFSTFQAALCNNLQYVYSCANISLDVRTFGSFSSVSVPIQLDAQGNPITQFNVGGAKAITAIRVIYKWTFFTPMIGYFFGDAANQRQLTSLTIFRNEPYQ